VNRPARIVASPQPVASSRENGPRRVVTQSLVDLVLEEVRRSILNGSLAPGADVSIAELSDRLGVSHIPVREALRRLEGEGLVVLRRGRAARVAPLSVRDLEEVLELRALVEADTLARAVRLYTPRDLAAIEHAWEMLRIEPDDDVEAVFFRHQEFHRLLVRPAADEWRRRILDILWQAGERYVRLLIVSSDSSSDPDRMRDAHATLLEAARSRSAREARRATLEHSREAIALVGRLLTGSAAVDASS
jgi:DNA-binding GntR family transcriptional regulator